LRKSSMDYAPSGSEFIVCKNTKVPDGSTGPHCPSCSRSLHFSRFRRMREVVASSISGRTTTGGSRLGVANSARVRLPRPSPRPSRPRGDSSRSPRDRVGARGGANRGAAADGTSVNARQRGAVVTSGRITMRDACLPPEPPRRTLRTRFFPTISRMGRFTWRVPQYFAPLGEGFLFRDR
jgi:hypothetical protein